MGLIIAINRKINVIAVPTAETGLRNSWRVDKARRRHQDGTTPKAFPADFEVMVTTIDQPIVRLPDLSVQEMVSFQNQRTYH